MGNKPFYNHIIFRLAVPPLLGIVVYLLVLMFFDSLSMLSENFFSREMMFTIGLTFFFLEGNRLLVIINTKIFSGRPEILTRAAVQYAMSGLLTVLLISGSLYGYFVLTEGFSTINTELITFNSIYLFAAFFYHLFFFSLLLTNRNNQVKLQQEIRKKDNLAMELQAFKNQVNPEFLLHALEIIISELHHEKKHADYLIGQISKTYRFSLENRFSDLIPLTDEIDSLDPLMEIFRAKYGRACSLVIVTGSFGEQYHILPGTLRVLVEYAISENIISEHLPLQIKVWQQDRKLILNYPLNKRLGEFNSEQKRLDYMLKTYSGISGQNSFISEKEGIREFAFPLFEVKED